jgi:hypothetical protein
VTEILKGEDETPPPNFGDTGADAECVAGAGDFTVDVNGLEGAVLAAPEVAGVAGEVTVTLGGASSVVGSVMGGGGAFLADAGVAGAVVVPFADCKFWKNASAFDFLARASSIFQPLQIYRYNKPIVGKNRVIIRSRICKNKTFSPRSEKKKPFNFWWQDKSKFSRWGVAKRTGGTGRVELEKVEGPAKQKCQNIFGRVADRSALIEWPRK